jgi:hypothetical protein
MAGELELSDAGRETARALADRHGVSPEAVAVLIRALAAGNGGQAQFSHPDLGGMGQWSRGGMIMIGDMFNSGLKAKVDALCAEVAAALREGGMLVARAEGPSASGTWWPADLGTPSATGSQNGMRYAVFPAARRVAVDLGGAVTVYDTGDHAISGVGQQQSGAGSLSFTGGRGPVRLEDLPVVRGAAVTAPDKVEAGDVPRPEPRGVPATTAGSGEDVFAKLERVADLHAKGILSRSEFEAKKAELLARI